MSRKKKATTVTKAVAKQDNIATAQNVKTQVDNMLDSMKSKAKDISVRIEDNKQMHENNKLASKTESARRNLHAYKTKFAFKKSSKAKQSRRALVIAYLHESKHTKKQIAQLLVSKHDIADLSNNLKCISGTMYDLQSNTTCNFKTDSKNEIISCVAENCKYRK